MEETHDSGVICIFKTLVGCVRGLTIVCVQYSVYSFVGRWVVGWGCNGAVDWTNGDGEGHHDTFDTAITVL